MTVLKRGMVIDVNLNPSKGSETGKIHPCVIVTNDVYNAKVPVIQVVPITGWTEKKGHIVTNVELQPSSKNGLTPYFCTNSLGLNFFIQTGRVSTSKNGSKLRV